MGFASHVFAGAWSTAVVVNVACKLLSCFMQWAMVIATSFLENCFYRKL